MTLPMRRFKAKVIRVVDGDSVIFRVTLRDQMVDLGFHFETHDHDETVISTRFLGINAPDYRTEGIERTNAASAYLRTLLPIGEHVEVETFKNPGDKFGRWLAIVHHPVLGNINDAMVAAGHAVAKTYAARPEPTEWR